MDKYLQNNRDLWNELTRIHAQSEFYDVEGFKKGKDGFWHLEGDKIPLIFSLKARKT